MLAESPMRPSTPKASAASLPPPLLRLLPGGANQFPGGFNSRCGPPPFTAHPIMRPIHSNISRVSPPLPRPITTRGFINTYPANFPSDGNQSFPIIMIMIGLLSSGDVMPGTASSNQKKSKRNPEGKLVFDAQVFLDSAGVSKKVIQYRKSQKISSQGEPATSVIYIQEGGVKLSV